MVRVNDQERWYVGKHLHRSDGPAVKSDSGKEMWFRNGSIHRTNGPAVTHEDGRIEWWLDGFKFDFESFSKKMKLSEKEKLLLKRTYRKRRR